MSTWASRAGGNNTAMQQTPCDMQNETCNGTDTHHRTTCSAQHGSSACKAPCAMYSMQDARSGIGHATCNMQHATCRCSMQHGTAYDTAHCTTHCELASLPATHTRTDQIDPNRSRAATTYRTAHVTGVVGYCVVWDTVPRAWETCRTGRSLYSTVSAQRTARSGEDKARPLRRG